MLEGGQMKRVEPIREKSKIDDIKKILRSKNERNYIMFCIAIYTPLRIGDILQLKVKDLKNKEYIRLIEEKTGKENKLFINPLLKRDLKKYLENRDDEEYIIKSRNGKNKPLERQMAYIIISKAAHEVGLQEIGVHSTRKTFGYHFDKDIRV
jgi:integrase